MPRLGRGQPGRPAGGVHPAVVIRNKAAATAGGRTAPVLVSYAETSWSTLTSSQSTTTNISWQAGDWIVIVGGTETNATGINTPTATGLTFTPGTPLAVASTCWGNTWTANPGTSGGPVAVNATTGSAVVWGIGVWVFRGSDGPGTRATDSTTTKTVSLARTADNSAAVEGLFDFSAGAVTSHVWTPIGQTERQAQAVGSNYTVYVANWGDQGGAGTTSYGITGTASTGAHTKLALEIKGTGVSASMVPLPNIRHRLPPLGLMRRNRSTSPVPAQVALSTPAFIPSAQHPHFRLYAARYRSRNTGPVPPQITATAPVFLPQSMQPVLRAVATRRRPVARPPVDQAPPPPASRTRLKLPRLLRRAAIGTPVPGQASPPGGWRSRLRLPRLTRPDQISPVPPQVTLTPPAYPPVGVRSHVKFWQAWRGHSATVVPPQIVLIPPAYPPTGIHQRPRALRLYRGHQATPVPPQITVVAPSFVPAKTRATAMKAVMVRRGRAVIPPAGQAAPPLIQRVRLRLARMFRGRPRQPVPAQVIVVPPVYPPQSIRSKRQLWSWRHRRLVSDGWLVGAAQHSCDTPRPNTGTTPRPGAGTTAYAAATTTRPSSGTTARPFTGTTEPPCGN